MSDQGWWVYMVRVVRDNSLYTGITRDLPRRLAQHRAGCGAKYLRGKGELTLVYQEPAVDKSAALRRERALKRLSKPAKEQLVDAQSS